MKTQSPMQSWLRAKKQAAFGKRKRARIIQERGTDARRQIRQARIAVREAEKQRLTAVRAERAHLKSLRAIIKVPNAAQFVEDTPLGPDITIPKGTICTIRSVWRSYVQIEDEISEPPQRAMFLIFPATSVEPLAPEHHPNP